MAHTASAVSLHSVLDSVSRPEFIYGFFLGSVIHYFAGQPTAHYLEYPLRLIAWMVLGSAMHADRPVFRLRNGEYMEKFAAALEARGVAIRTESSCVLVSRSEGGITLRLAAPWVEHVNTPLTPRMRTSRLPAQACGWRVARSRSPGVCHASRRCAAGQDQHCNTPSPPSTLSPPFTSPATSPPTYRTLYPSTPSPSSRSTG